MAYLILPSRRTRHPNRYVTLDRSHPLAPATGLWFPEVNAVTGRLVSSGGTGSEPTLSAIPSGRAYYTAGKWLQTDVPSAQFSSFSFVAIIRPTAGPGSSNFCSFLQTGQATLNWNHTSASYQGALTIYNSGAYPTCKWTSGFTAGQEVVIGGTYNGATSLLSVYRNGALENFRSSTGNGVAGLSLNSLQFLGGTGGTVPWDGSCSYFYWDATRALNDDQMRELMRAPWSVLTPDPRRLYFDVSGGAGAYTLDAQPGGYTVSGTAATLARGIVIDAQPATYTVSGTAATLVRGYNLNAQPGSYTATGTAASLVRGYVVDAAPGSFSLTGAAATLEKVTPGVYTLDAQPGSYSLTGVAATLTYTPLNAYTLDAQPGTYTLTGAAATLTYAGSSIWTDVGVSSVTWSDVGGATSIWSDL